MKVLVLIQVDKAIEKVKWYLFGFLDRFCNPLKLAVLEQKGTGD
jgi:hypothetical protein